MTELEQLLQQAENALSELMQQNERERKFAEASHKRFDANIRAFEKYYPDIARTIKEYVPSEDFKILVTSTGVGNFIPSHATVPIYSDNPIEQTRQQLEKNTAKGYYSLTQYGFDIDDRDHRIHSRYMASLTKIIKKYNNQNNLPLSALPAHFPTAILFGVGLGYIVTELLDKHSFDYIYISEPDLEVFYASLFCTDWQSIIELVDNSNGTLFFQIGLSVEEFFTALYNVASDVGAHSIVRAFCYQHYPSIEVNRQIKEFFSRSFELQAGFGFYNDAITGLAHCLKNYRNGAKFYIKPKSRTYIPLPVAIVGNGPSLDAAAEVLREIQDKVIILACGTALGSLVKLGIKADFHVLVERTKSTYDALFDMLDPSYYADLDLLSVDVMYPEVIGLYRWAGLGLKGPEAATVFTQFLGLKHRNRMIPSLPYCGPLVANTGLSYAYVLGFSEVYLFGVDNGYSAGKTHSSHSIYASNASYGNAVNESAKIKLKGNLGGDVYATNLLALAHSNMEKLVKVDKKITVYNVGEGAFIDGAHPLNVDDVFISKLSHSKLHYINMIKEKSFSDLNFEIDQGELAFSIFDEICEHLNSIADEKFYTRNEASDILKRQARYVYAFRSSRYSHLFRLIKGSMLYYHCPMITVLYQYEDEQISLRCFSEILELWKEYVNEVKSDYRASWTKNCEYDMKLHLSLKS